MNTLSCIFSSWSILHYIKKLLRLCHNHIGASTCNPSLRDVIMIRIGQLKEIMHNSENIKKLKILHTKKVSKASITGAWASYFFVQHLSWKHTCMGWRGNVNKPKVIKSFQLSACLSLNNLPFKLNQNTKRSLLMARFEKVLSVSN